MSLDVDISLHNSVNVNRQMAPQAIAMTVLGRSTAQNLILYYLNGNE